MKMKIRFTKALALLSSFILGVSAASVCGMGMEEMPESIKKLR